MRFRDVQGLGIFGVQGLGSLPRAGGGRLPTLSQSGCGVEVKGGAHRAL